MTEAELKHYIEKYKEHEAERASTNKRTAYWKQYAKEQRDLDSETSFNMGRFAQ